MAMDEKWRDFQFLLDNTATAATPRPPEADMVSRWAALMAQPDEKAWEKVRGKAFSRAISWGYTQWFDQMAAHNTPDPEFYVPLASLAMACAAQSWSTPASFYLAQACLTLTQGAPLTEYGEGMVRAVMTMRPEKDHAPGDIPRLPALLQLLLDDARFEDLNTQCDLWRMAGEQGQPLALDGLKSWHERLMAEKKSLAEFPVMAWEGALLKALSGANPECACAAVVEKTRPWINDEQIRSYLGWAGNQLNQLPQYWTLYDHLFKAHLEGTHSEAAIGAKWDLAHVRDLMYAQASEHMPIETARRRSLDSLTQRPAGPTRPRHSRA